MKVRLGWVALVLLAAAAGFTAGERKCARRYESAIAEQAQALAGLNPAFLPAVLRVLAAANEQAPPGRVLMAYEGARSLARQRELLAAGFTKLAVGAHCTGRACDLVWVVRGRWTWDEAEPYGLIGPAAHAEGLTWGGSWAGFRDVYHVEAPDWARFVPPAVGAPAARKPSRIPEPRGQTGAGQEQD